MKENTINKYLFSSILIILAVFAFFIVYHAPKVSIPAYIEITPGNKPVTLGYKELGQRKSSLSADSSHVRIEKIDGLWTIANISQKKRVEIKTNKHDSRYLKRWPLQANDKFKLNDQAFQVTTVDSSGYLTLLHLQSNRTASWKNGYLQVSDPFLYKQARSLRWRIQKRIRWLMSSLSSYWEKEMQLFSIGGGVNTPDRWRINGLSPKYAHIGWYKEQFYLIPGKNERFIQMSLRSNQTMQDFSHIQYPLNKSDDPVKQLIIGKTYYRVKCSETNIRLFPFRNYDVWFKHEKLPLNMEHIAISCHSEVFIGFGSMNLKSLLKKLLYRLVIVFLIGLGLIVIIQAKFSRTYRFQLLIMTVPSVILTGISVNCWTVHHGLDLSWCLFFFILSWTWATFWLWYNHHLTGINQIIWACAIILAGIGAMTLTQLAVGSDNIKWLDYPRKHLLVLSMFGWFLPVISLIPSQLIGRIFVSKSAEFKLIRIGIFSLLIGILIYHFFKGSEQGLGLFQPSELAKFLFIVVGALTGMHLSELRLYDAEHLYQHPVQVIWSFINTFIFVLCLALFVFLSVRDISPMVISCFFLLCIIWKIAPHPDSNHITLSEYICRGCVLIICVIIVIMTAIIYFSPEHLPEWMPQKDRFLVWSSPELFPHSGEQVIKSMTIAGLGKWFGATDSWFGYNHSAMTVPMIQNDFIGAFILYRWGGMIAIVLLVTQLFYIQALFEKAVTMEKLKNTGFEKRRMYQIFILIIHGFVWMTGIQWLISWSNVLGLFPVMGQPMTWISQANSHLIFFALPSLAFAIIVGHSQHEDIYND